MKKNILNSYKNYILIFLSFLVFALSASTFKYQAIDFDNNNDFVENKANFIAPKYFDFYFQEQNSKLDNFVRYREVNIFLTFKPIKSFLQIKSQVLSNYCLLNYKIDLSSKEIFKDFYLVFPFHYFY